MNSIFKYGTLENIRETKRIPIGSFWDVKLSITPLTWLNPFIFFGLHFIATSIITNIGFTERLYQAMIFTIAVEISTALHAFGHILSGKIVKSPMDELLITTTRDINVYNGDQSNVAGKVHLGRALGGPLLNIFVAGIFYTLVLLFNQGFVANLLSSLISVNLFLGLGSFLPVPTVDGQVIWREIFRLTKKDK